MIGRTNAGGVGLNFKVIPNPQPSTAKENTIWVDTDRINNCYFSATQPENMSDYDMWFQVGTNSNVAFPATKRNPIMVYPILAKQYISGALVDKNAKSYQGGTWVAWFAGTYIYRKGNQFTDRTGGFETLARSGSYWSTTNVKYNSDHIAFSYGNGPTVSYASTKNMIDLTNVDTVTINVESFTGDYLSRGRLAATKTKSSQASIHETAAAVKQFDAYSAGKIVLDVSNLSGSYYIAFGACFEGTTTGTLKVTEAWIE